MATAFADFGRNEAPAAEEASPSTAAGESAQPATREKPVNSANPNFLAGKLAEWGKALIAPLIGIVAFLALWAVLAPQVDTSLGALPGPVEVAEQGVGLFEEWSAAKDAEAQFYAQQDASNAAAVASGNPGAVHHFDYAGAPTFLDQIFTSLKTVALGFVLATLVAVPIGLVCGLSPLVNAAINPLVQIMKPVSPLAWLPIVTMVISATISSADPVLPKSFVISAIVVMLCSLWPTLINTAVGTASIDKDLLNVGRVLKLGWFAKLTRLVLPASLPYIFTGMRLSLGVGWMVLIAAEMLAQNPGLGKFVWDEFQNGIEPVARPHHVRGGRHRPDRLPLDRLMMALQALASQQPHGLTMEHVPILSLRGVTKRYTGRPAVTEVLGGIDLDVRGRRIRRHPRLLGRRQDHADLHHRRPDRARRGRDPAQGQAVERAGQGSRAGVPVLLAVSLADSASRTSPWRSMPFTRIAAAAERAALVRQKVELVGLGHAMDRKPSQLSGGMRQRVAVARALAMEPEILLLDEPLSALDALTRAKLQDEIERIRKEEGRTIILVTNDVDEALLLADRVAVLTPAPAARIGQVFIVDVAAPARPRGGERRSALTSRCASRSSPISARSTPESGTVGESSVDLPECHPARPGAARRRKPTAMRRSSAVQQPLSRILQASTRSTPRPRGR